MPRLGDQDYLKRCHWLRLVWLEPPQILLAVLSPAEQWDMHAYFQPNKDLSDDQRLQQRRLIAKTDRLLPPRAGKAFLKLRRLCDEARQNSDGDPAKALAYIRSAVPVYVDNKGRRIRGVALVRPEPDLEKLARTLLQMAIEEETLKAA